MIPWSARLKAQAITVLNSNMELLVPALWTEGQLGYLEVETSLADKVSFRTVRVLHKETVSKQNKQRGIEEMKQVITEKLRSGDCSKSLDHQWSGKARCGQLCYSG